MEKQDKTTDRLNTYVTILLLLVLTSLLAWLSVRFPLEIELTRNSTTGLSQASMEILDKMEDTIAISSYARDDRELRNRVSKFVNRYRKYKQDITLQFINPDAAPDETRNLGIETDGELVIRYRGRQEHVHTDSEQQFTNALQRLLRGTKLWLAFVEGHGERSPLEDNNHDLSIWGNNLRSRGFNLQPINIARFNTIPDNTSVLVIANPQTVFLPGEVDILIEYLDKGGNLLWLIDPDENNGLEKLREYFGLEITPGTIIEIAGQVIGVDDPTITLATRQLYADHPAVEQFSLTTLFPMATAVDSTLSAPWRKSTVISTAAHTWLERGELKGEIGFDDQQDLLGPLNLAISLERDLEDRQQRVMIVGDGDFVSNNFIRSIGNLELSLRMVEWLVRNDGFISIPATTVDDVDLQLPQVMRIILGFGFPIIIPLSLIATGCIIWWRRKNL